MVCVIKYNICGNIHDSDSIPYELWNKHKPDLLTMPMTSSRSAVMAHTRLKQQDNQGNCVILSYAVGMASRHKVDKGAWYCLIH